MARQAKMLASSAKIKFIAYDDSAIKQDETIVERYREYLKSGDHTKLELDPDKSPAYYYFRPLKAQWLHELNLALQPDSDPSEMYEAGKTFLAQILIGCDDHPMVTEFQDNGELISEHVKWEPGTPAREGLVASILADEMFCSYATMYLYNISRLTETEKKR